MLLYGWSTSLETKLPGGLLRADHRRRVPVGPAQTVVCSSVSITRRVFLALAEEEGPAPHTVQPNVGKKIKYSLYFFR
jgi:hypothetical protein